MISQIAHLPFYLADQRCEVIALAESRPSLRSYLIDSLGVNLVVEDEQVVLNNTNISAVVIIAPRAASGPLALAALEAGKDVLVEKPMAHSFQQASRLVEQASASKKILSVAYMKRYDPGVQAAKQELETLVSSNALGRLLFARFYDYARDYAHAPPPHKRPEESRVTRFATWPTAPEWMSARHKDDYAWFMNAASHDINLITYFFPIEDLQLIHATSPTGQGLTATFEVGQVPVVFELAKSASGEWVQGAEFVFEKGRLLLEMPSPMATGRVAQVRISENAEAVGVRELSVENVWCFNRQAREFISDLLARKKPLTTGLDVMHELNLIEAIWRRIDHNKANHVS